MSGPAADHVHLLAASAADFASLKAGDGPAGLTLPAGGVEHAEVLDLLAALVAKVRVQIDPAAWLIVSAGEVVGLCSITRAFVTPGVVEIGYGIAPVHRGRGLATAAVRHLLELAKSDGRICIVTAETATDNRASQRTLEKNGFTRTGERVDAQDGPLLVWQVVIG